MRSFVDNACQTPTAANPRTLTELVKTTRPAFIDSEDAGLEKRHKRNRDGSYVRVANQIQLRLDNLFGKGNAQLTRIAGTGDCMWWALERALVQNPQKGTKIGKKILAYGDSLGERIVQWKHMVKLYYAVIHGPQMSQAYALNVLHNRGPKDCLRTISKVSGPPEEQIKLIKAAFVAHFSPHLSGVNTKSKDDMGYDPPDLNSNLAWFQLDCPSGDRWCDSEWLGYVSTLLQTPIWCVGETSVQVFSPGSNKSKSMRAMSIIKSAIETFRVYAERLYGKNEPIVVTMNGCHYDLVTNFKHMPNFAEVMNTKMKFFSTRFNMADYSYAS